MPVRPSWTDWHFLFHITLLSSFSDGICQQFHSLRGGKVNPDVLDKHQFFRPIAGADAEVFSQQSGHDDRACGADRSDSRTVATSLIQSRADGLAGHIRQMPARTLPMTEWKVAEMAQGRATMLGLAK